MPTRKPHRQSRPPQSPRSANRTLHKTQPRQGQVNGGRQLKLPRPLKARPSRPERTPPRPTPTRNRPRLTASSRPLAAKLNAQTQTSQAKVAPQTTSGSQTQTAAGQAADAKDAVKVSPQSSAQQANQAQAANAATQQTSAGTANTTDAGNTGTDATESGAATAGESQPTDQTARTHARGAGDSLTGLAQHNAAQAAADKPTAEVDANLQAQAKLTEHATRAAQVRPAADDATQSNDARMAHATATLAEAGRTHHAAATDGVQQADAATAADRPRPAEQIIESVRQAVRDGQRELTINLNPPELGRVRLKMYAEGGAVTGRIEVENTHTLHEIRQQAELLTERLTADGITFRRLEVHQMGSTNSQTSSYTSAQQDASGQNAFSQGRQGEPSVARDRLMPEPAATAPARSVAAGVQSGAGQPERMDLTTAPPKHRTGGPNPPQYGVERQ